MFTARPGITAGACLFPEIQRGTSRYDLANHHENMEAGTMDTRAMHRREALRLMAGAGGLALLGLSGCTSGSKGGERVVVYCSIEREVIEPLFEAFTKGSGIAVDLVGDTEATKSTGLVQRVLSERSRPRADVWLSSEAVGTALLAAQGALMKLDAAEVQPVLAAALAQWPMARVRREGFIEAADRPRRVVYNTRLVQTADLPQNLAALADPRWRGRVVVAKPRFGTTRGHLGALFVKLGEEGFRSFVKALRGNEVREVDGNSAVVRAVSRGEAWLGLTDSDDIAAGQREGWPVAAHAGFPAGELICTPTTLGIIRGGPNPDGAQKLAAWLLAGELERALCTEAWGGVSVKGDGGCGALDWVAVETAVEMALRIWEAQG